MNDEALMRMRRQLGVPVDLEACHTAEVAGLAVEGHVPAETIRRFLRERPAAAVGIAVPGMPIGSPGMEQGNARQPYNVFSFTRDGRTAVFERR